MLIKMLWKPCSPHSLGLVHQGNEGGGQDWAGHAGQAGQSGQERAGQGIAGRGRAGKGNAGGGG